MACSMIVRGVDVTNVNRDCLAAKWAWARDLHKCKGRDIHATLMNGGKFCFPSADDKDEFLRQHAMTRSVESYLRASALKQNLDEFEKAEPPTSFIVERRTSISVLAMDLDIESTGSRDERVAMAHHLMNLTKDVLREVASTVDMPVLILWSRDKPTSEGRVKTGFHVHFCHVFVDGRALHYIRAALLERLPGESPGEGWNTWEAIVDGSVMAAGGSLRAPGAPKCRRCRCKGDCTDCGKNGWVYEGRPYTLMQVFRLCDGELEDDPALAEELAANPQKLVAMASISCHRGEAASFEVPLAKLEPQQLEPAPKKARVAEITPPAPAPERYSAHLDNIAMKYLENYDDWIRIVFAATTAGVPSEKIEEVTAKCGKDRDVRERLVSNKGQISAGTLLWYSKQSNGDRYMEIESSHVFRLSDLEQQVIGKAEEEPVPNLTWLDDPESCDSDLRLAAQYVMLMDGEIRYARDSYYLYDAKTALWKCAKPHDVLGSLGGRLSAAVVLRIAQLKIEATDAAAIERLQELRRRVESTTQQQRCLPHVASQCTDEAFWARLDANRDILPFSDGQVVDFSVIDGERGCVRSRTKEDYCTWALSGPAPAEWRRCDVKWVESFMGDLFQGDAQVVRYVQKLLGYGITGHVSEQILIVWAGCASAGKSCLCRVLDNLLSNDAGHSFYVSMEASTLLAAKHERAAGSASPDLVKLDKKRLAVLTETALGATLDEVRVKQLAGGDKIPCRPLYGAAFDIAAYFLPVLVTNTLPRLRMDDATIRRVVVLEFMTKFVPAEQMPRDPPPNIRPRINDFEEVVLREHREAMWAWLIAGAVSWYEKPDLVSNKPERVLRATQQWVEENDALQQFIDDRLQLGSELHVLPLDVHRAFEAFCAEHGLQSMTQRALVKALGEKGLACVQKWADGANKRRIIGASLKIY